MRGDDGSLGVLVDRCELSALSGRARAGSRARDGRTDRPTDAPATSAFWYSNSRASSTANPSGSKPPSPACVPSSSGARATGGTIDESARPANRPAHCGRVRAVGGDAAATCAARGERSAFGSVSSTAATIVGASSAVGSSTTGASTTGSFRTGSGSGVASATGSSADQISPYEAFASSSPSTAAVSPSAPPVSSARFAAIALRRSASRAGSRPAARSSADASPTSGSLTVEDNVVGAKARAGRGACGTKAAAPTMVPMNTTEVRIIFNSRGSLTSGAKHNHN